MGLASLKEKKSHIISFMYHTATDNKTYKEKKYNYEKTRKKAEKAMHRLPANLYRKIAGPACDVFINHRGIDTKRTIVRLLYNHLTKLKVRPFLDTSNMKPGDRLFDHIDKAILGCKVGVAVFSPRYCASYFCLHELALLMESKKRIIPIFYDVKPSELQIRDDGSRPAKELHRFSLALEEAKYIVGLSYDSLKGDWSELVRNASEAVVMNLLEVEEEHKNMQQHP